LKRSDRAQDEAGKGGKKGGEFKKGGCVRSMNLFLSWKEKRGSKRGERGGRGKKDDVRKGRLVMEKKVKGEVKMITLY